MGFPPKETNGIGKGGGKGKPPNTSKKDVPKKVGFKEETKDGPVN